MLDFAEFNNKMFLVYCKNSNESRTLVGVLLLSFRGIFSLALKGLGFFIIRRLIRTLGVALASRSRSAYSAFFFIEVKN
jgi:hypothetical protein